jgi:hypothetical protein
MIHPFGDITLSSSANGQIEDVGNYFTGYPLFHFWGAEFPDGWDSCSPSALLYDFTTSSRDNRGSCAFVQAAYSSNVSYAPAESQAVTPVSGDYVYRAQSTGSLHRSQIEGVADGATSQGGSFPRYLTHQREYCYAMAYYDTTSGSGIQAMEFHNNSDPPSSLGSSFDWYIDGSLQASNQFTTSTVNRNPQFSYERVNSSYYEIVHRTEGAGWREDTHSGAIVPVNLNDWTYVVFVVEWDNNTTNTSRGSAPAGGWQGKIQAYYATGANALTKVYDVSGIRMGWLYAGSDNGPNIVFGQYLDNTMLAYYDNVLIARIDQTGMTYQECDPRNYRIGGPQNTVGMTFSSTGLPSGLTRNSDGTLQADGSVQTGSFTETLTVTVPGVGSQQFQRDIAVN